MFPGGDPLKIPLRGERVKGGRDYTKFVRWTPLKIAFAVVAVGVPYAILVFAIASATTPIIALPFIVIPIILGATVVFMYRVARW